MSDLFLPLLPRSEMFIGGTMSMEWQEFFRQLFVRVGEYDASGLGEFDLGLGGSSPASSPSPDQLPEASQASPPTEGRFPESSKASPPALDQIPEPSSRKIELVSPEILIPSPKQEGLVWDDIQFPISGGKVPAANYPTYASFTTNTMAYKFDVDDYIDLQSNEMHHWWKEGTSVYPHIHIALDGANASGDSYYTKFTIYLAYATGGGAFVEVEQDIEIEIPDGSVDLEHFIEGDTAVDFSSLEIGTQVNPRVKRIAATTGTEYPNDVFILQIGLHAEKDSRGSVARNYK